MVLRRVRIRERDEVVVYRALHEKVASDHEETYQLAVSLSSTGPQLLEPSTLRTICKRRLELRTA